jgi:DNA polymerase bacteriophage-type
MHILHRDIETRSTIDLPDVGAWRYAGDPSTAVWCVAYAVDDAPVQIWIPGQPIPEEFHIAARDPDWLIAAHNDPFERSIEERILAPRYGWPIVPIERHRCTMAMASACALPAKLETVAEVLELHNRKDTAGSRLMKQLARADGDNADAEKLERLYDYCRQDVEVERELFHRLPPLTDSEQALWVLDAVINQRGFHTDGPLLEAASRIAAEAGQAMQAELARITGGALMSTDQVAAMLAWLAEHGCDVKDLRKPTLSHALRRKDLDPIVRRVIELRIGAAHAAATKIDALLAWRDADDRVRGTLRFHGAGTGRWTGHGPQPQNFKRDSDGIEAKRIAISTGDLAHVAKIYTQPLEVVGDIARSMICAAPGHRFLIGDFSGIESRVLAWISGQQSKLDMWAKFDRTGDPKDEPYYLLGRSCGQPEDSARSIGKTADLAFGYMGGPGAWDRLAPDDDPSSDDDKRRYQQAWRRLHPETAKFWGGINRAAIQAVRKPGTTFNCRQLTAVYDGETFLRIMLPSGRALSYPQPRITTGKFGDAVVMFKDNAGGKFVDCRYGQGAYGGLWTENVVQAVSRDLLAAAMQRLEAAGYHIVLHVHDEIVAEAPIEFGSIEEFQQLITAPLPDWAGGLPIAAKIRNGPRFAKSESKSETPETTPPWVDASPHAATSMSPGNPAAVDHQLDVAPQNSSTNSTETPPPAPDEIPMTDAKAEPDSVTVTESIDGLEIVDMPWIDINAIKFSHAGAGTNDTKSNGADDRRNESRHDERAHQCDYSGRSSANNDGYPHGERDTGRQVAFFTYLHADGRPYLGVKKTSAKQFPQYHWNGHGWAKGAPKGPKIPYRLPELIKAPLDALIIIAAGEKDADTAARLGFVATTNPEGERKGAWALELNAWFAGRKHVAIMEDNDDTGRAHVLEVAEALRGIVPDIRIVTFRDLPDHGDLTDWIALNHGRDDLLAKIKAAKPYHQRPQPLPIWQWDGEPVPELEYAVPDRFPLENVGLFSGEGGQGKSSLVEQLCVAHALEQEWLGCIPRQGPAVYIECEDTENVLHWRLKVIAEHYGATFADIVDRGFQMYSLADEENAILATASDKSGIVRPTPLYDWLYELAGDIKPVMIGLASSANIFAGNENVRTEVQQFIRLLRRIASVAHGAVLLVTQPSLSGIDNKSISHEGLAGTTQWHNAVRARAVMKTVKSEDGVDTGLRAVAFHKNQYGPAGATCFVRYTGGLFLPVEGMEGMSMGTAERAAKADEVFVALLRKMMAQHQTVCHASGRGYAPARFAEQPEAQGITKKEFAKAMQRLLDAGVIEIRTGGRPSRPHYYLSLAGEA